MSSRLLEANTNMKAKIPTDKICPDFLYDIVELTEDTVTLGWHGRRGFWNETTRKLHEVVFVIDEVKESET